MAATDLAAAPLRFAARRAYETGRFLGALWRGTAAAALALPGFLLCNQTPWAAACLAGFGLVVAAGRMRGEDYEQGTRSGAIAGILPCLLPAAIRLFDPSLCVLLSERGPWICGIGGAAAALFLGLRGRRAGGAVFWASAAAAMAFPASLGCMPAGAIGFLGLAIGLIAGGVPALVARRA